MVNSVHPQDLHDFICAFAGDRAANDPSYCLSDLERDLRAKKGFEKRWLETSNWHYHPGMLKTRAIALCKTLVDMMGKDQIRRHNSLSRVNLGMPNDISPLRGDVLFAASFLPVVGGDHFDPKQFAQYVNLITYEIVSGLEIKGDILRR